ncbi:MAG: asparagine synthase (glutamine-hydrolyzing) [Pseudomonadota bacterium]
MCGIAGILESSGAVPDRDLLQRMIARLRHRGPDEQGLHVEKGAGLAHARLSIIDLASGQQPMRSPESGLVLAFNGEIFNYLELRDELVALGHGFRTQSDTEVVLRAYEAWGADCVQRFNGQWAIALWDPARQRLFASRDRLGIRPFFYTRLRDQLVFGSEIKALLAHPEVQARVDLQGLDQYFTYWTSVPPRTFFADILELPPGHNLEFHAGALRTWRYWQLDYPTPAPALAVDEAVEQLSALLRDSVRLRLRADVPVGAYLSGGLDSALTVALIRELTDAPLETFSVGFDHPDYDESSFQQLAVAQFGTRHHHLQCGGDDIARAFSQVVWQAEQPLLRSAPAPLFLLSGQVRENNFKVVVTGEGADELFGGYDLFKEAKLRRFWAKQPDSRCRPLLLRRLYPYMSTLQAQPVEVLRSVFHVKPEALASPYFSHLPRWELTARLKQFYSPAVKAALAGGVEHSALPELLPENFARWDPFCQAQHLETALLLPGYLLSAQGDRMTMGHSVEGRFPFLDHRVAEFAAALPPRLKMRVLDEKYLLKQLGKGRIPAPILARPKQPYRAPDLTAFIGPAGALHPSVADALEPHALAAAGLFHPPAVAALVRKCQAGRAIGTRDAMALVGILSTQLLMKQFKIHDMKGPAHG